MNPHGLITEHELSNNLRKYIDELKIKNPEPLTIQEGIQAVNVLSNSALNVQFDGRTVVNLVPPFTSREWNLHANTTVLENGKILEINGDSTSYTIIKVDFNKQYTLSCKFSGRIYIKEDDYQGNIIDQHIQNEFGYFQTTFTVPDGVDKIAIFIHPSTAQVDYPYIVENLSLHEGTKALPYVRGVQHTRNPYVIASGKNMLEASTSLVSSNSPHINLGAYKAEIQYSGSFATRFNGNKFIELVGGKNYVLSIKSRKISGDNIGLVLENEGGQDYRVFQLNTTSELANNSFEFIPENDIRVRIKITRYSVDDIEGRHYIEDWQLELGDTATEFEEHYETYLFGKDVVLAEGERAYQNANGEWRKWQTTEIVVLDGRENWELANNYVGFKRLTLSQFPDAVKGVGAGNKVVKYDGKLLTESGTGSTSSGDRFVISLVDDLLYLNISNQDSGWGDGYAPTPEEIKAYFMGWKMYGSDDSQPYTGTNGVKMWKRLDPRHPSGMTGTGTTELPTEMSPSMLDGTISPYQLHYKLATPREVPIEFEGSLRVHKGLNQIEVGTGVVVRERANPYETNAGWNINRGDTETTRVSALKYQTNNIRKIYKKGIDDDWAIHTNNPLGYGGCYAILRDKNRFDPTASYSATYFVLDKHLFTAGLGGITAEYNTNFATRLEENEKTLINQVRKLSVVENELFPLLASSEIVDHNLHIENPPLGYYVRYANGIQICMRAYKPDWATSGTQEDVIAPASFVRPISGGFLLPSTTTKELLEYFTDVFVMHWANGWRIYIPETPPPSLITGSYVVQLLIVARWK